jgi:hypothetical protein
MKHFVAPRDWLIASKPESKQRPRRVSGSIARHHNRFLAQVASLLVGDRLRRSADVEGEAIFVDVSAVNGRARFDPQDVVCRKSGRLRARFG